MSTFSSNTPRESVLLRSIRLFWKSLKIFTLFLGVLMGAALLVTSFSFNRWKEARVNRQLEEPSRVLSADERVFLHLRLNGTLKEIASASSWFEEFYSGFSTQQKTLNLLDLRTQLERASVDERVEGLVVELRSLSANLGLVEELRKILFSFHEESKKPIVFWLHSANTKTYYLASVAGQIYLAPGGSLDLSQPGMVLTYLGSALKKLGVGVQVLRAGKFKSAFESLVQDSPSRETLEAYRALDDSLRTHLEAGMQRRFTESGKAKNLMAKSLFSAKSAISEGLVNQLAHFDELNQLVVSGKKVDFFLFRDYRKESPSVKGRGVLGEDNSQPGLAFIEARGEIHMHAEGSKSQVDPWTLRKKIQWAKNEDKVRGVLLHIDSPGGSALASELIHRDLKELAVVKPLVVSMGSVAASGGYYLASAAHKIFAYPTTLTGSIGVVGLFLNFASFQQKYGVSFHYVGESDLHNLINPGKALRLADRKKIQDVVNDTYDLFLKRVSQGRSIDISEVAKIAEGRVWTGIQAKELGLVDDLGGLTSAKRELKRLADLDMDTLCPLYRYEAGDFDLATCLADPRNCLPSVLGRVEKLSDFSSSFESLSQANHSLRSWEKDPVQALWLPGKLQAVTVR